MFKNSNFSNFEFEKKKKKYIVQSQIFHIVVIQNCNFMNKRDSIKNSNKKQSNVLQVLSNFVQLLY